MKRQSIVKIIIIGIFCLVSIALLFSIIFIDKKTPRKGSNSGEMRLNAGLGRAGGSVPETLRKYVIEKGDTLGSIASDFNLSVNALVRRNRIDDDRRLTAGDAIELTPGIVQPEEAKQHAPRLAIESSRTDGIAPLYATLSISRIIPDGVVSFVWDFGDGMYSFEKEPSHTFLKPGIYRARLSGFSEGGDEIGSNTVEIDVRSGNLKTKDLNHMTIDKVNAVLDMTNRVNDFFGNPVMFDRETKIIQNPALLDQIGTNKFLAVAAGYSMVTLVRGKQKYTFDLFVSPFPTQHSVEPGFDWYKTQFDTGIWGNCGPACVAMAVHWSTAENISVEKNREEIGMPYPKGALTYENMLDNFKLHKITAFLITANRFEDIKEVIDRGRVAIILFDTTYIRHVKGDKTLVFTDRYYPDTTGHYVVIKGYSLDKKYFVVYDPIPGDWKANEPRYTDGVSMLGRNRYFLADEIFDSIRGKEVVVVCRR